MKSYFFKGYNKVHSKLHLILIVCSLHSTSSQIKFNPIVTTNNGVIEGKSFYENGKNTYVFKGIPYAEPPIGQLRFRKPLPSKTWDQTYIAFDFKPQCIQSLNTTFTSEDCLYLNIWSTNIKSDAKLPVMLWIHGGGLIIGSASELENHIHIYDGTQLAQKEVVIMTINYRLGVFGYVFADNDDAPGNVGFWDQAMALKWTKDNIAAFGGNPDDITIFGESAGGWSVSSHIISPVTMNLFEKAIIQSGSLYIKLYLTDKDYAYKFSRDFATNSSYFGKNSCLDHYKWIECLRNKTVKELNDAQTAQYQSSVEATIIGTLFKPIFGDHFLPQSAVEAIKNGNFKRDIRLMIGHNEMEGLYIPTTADPITLQRYKPNKTFTFDINKKIVKNDIKNIFILNNNELGDKIADLYTAPFLYSELSLIQLNHLKQSAVYSGGDYTLTCPTILFGANLAKHISFKGKVYQYRLTYANSKSIAYGSEWAFVSHLDDLPLVFGRPLHENNWTQEDKRMSSTIVDIWTYFAKYGSAPRVNGNRWPEYSILRDGSVNASYLELNPNDYRLGKVFINRYKGNDSYIPKVVNNCIDFWDKIFIDQY